MFLGALVLKGNRDGSSAIFNHIKDRNPLNYDHANLHPAKTANYMSGGHSVIQNNCHYIFIYSFYATPFNYHGYNLKRFSQTFIWSQHTNVNLWVNYGCTQPVLFKREKMKMESESRPPRTSQAHTKLHVRLLPAAKATAPRLRLWAWGLLLRPATKRGKASSADMSFCLLSGVDGCAVCVIDRQITERPVRFQIS